MDFADLTTRTPTFLLVLARVGGLLALAPVLAEKAVPWKLRAMLAVAIAAALTAAGGTPVPAPADAAGLVAAMARQLVVGAAMGLAAGAIFAGVELGAFHVAQQLGVGLAELYDPSAEEASGGIRRFYRLLAVVLFLAIGGHRTLLAAGLRNLQEIPLAGSEAPATVLGLAAAVLKVSFVLAIKTAAPVLAAMLLAALALGLLQKTMPAWNTLTVGLPARAVLGLVVAGGALAVLPALVESAWNLALKQVAAMAKAMG